MSLTVLEKQGPLRSPSGWAQQGVWDLREFTGAGSPMKLQFRGTPNASAPPALSPEREPWGPATVGSSVRVHQQDRVQRAGWGGRQVVKRGRGVLPQTLLHLPQAT